MAVVVVVVAGDFYVQDERALAVGVRGNAQS